jgi:hypothetical protein
MGKHRGRDEWAKLVAEYEQVAETQSLRSFAKANGIGTHSLGVWRRRIRDEDQAEQRLVPLVVHPGAGAAVIVRLGAEPTVEILDPERTAAAWVIELLRELTKGSA